MEFAGIAHAAMGQDRPLAGVVAGLGAKVFGGVGFGSAGLARVIESGGAQHHQPGRLQFGPALRQRVLDRLILADGALENHAIAGVFTGESEGPAPDPDRLGGDQAALRVQAVEKIAKPPALVADPVAHGHPQAVVEDHVRVDRVAAHLRDLADLDMGRIQLGEEQRQALGRAACIVVRRARQQHDAVRLLRRRGPDLPAADHIVAPVAPRGGGDPGGVETGIRLGDAKAGDQIAGDDRRQPGGFLFGGAVLDDRLRAEDVQVDGARRRHGAGRVGDGLHHHHRLGDAEAGAAEFFRHGDPQPAARRHRPAEVMREGRGLVALEPVGPVEGLHQPLNRFADRLLVGRQLSRDHARSSLQRPVASSSISQNCAMPITIAAMATPKPQE
jgi:hypothetical protein